MVGAPLSAAQLAHNRAAGASPDDAGAASGGQSATEHALAHEAALRLALRDVADTLPESDAGARAAAVARVVNAALPDAVVFARPLLRAMRDAVLNAATAALSSSPTPSPSSSGAIGVGKPDSAGNGDHVDEDDDDDKDGGDKEGGDKDGDEEMSATSPTATLAAQTSSCSITTATDPVARAARALDDFVSVGVIGARAKVSAFFDQMIVQTEWTRIAVVAGSSVAEAAFLAVNHPKKALTVLDAGPRWPGRALADKLAWQTGASVRYAAVTAAQRALEGVDVVVMGAREVLANGFVVADGGAAIVAHMAQEAGVPVVVTAQAAKVSERASVEWAEGDADMIRAREVQRLVTELDSAVPERAGVWRTDLAPEVVRKREGGASVGGASVGS